MVDPGAKFSLESQNLHEIGCFIICTILGPLRTLRSKVFLRSNYGPFGNFKFVWSLLGPFDFDLSKPSVFPASFVGQDGTTIFRLPD